MISCHFSHFVVLNAKPNQLTTLKTNLGLEITTVSHVTITNLFLQFSCSGKSWLIFYVQLHVCMKELAKQIQNF